jgi:hypothetical protein
MTWRPAFVTAERFSSSRLVPGTDQHCKAFARRTQHVGSLANGSCQRIDRGDGLWRAAGSPPASLPRCDFPPLDPAACGSVPLSCPPGAANDARKPIRRGIIIRVSGVRVPLPHGKCLEMRAFLAPRTRGIHFRVSPAPDTRISRPKLIASLMLAAGLLRGLPSGRWIQTRRTPESLDRRPRPSRLQRERAHADRRLEHRMPVRGSEPGWLSGCPADSAPRATRQRSGGLPDDRLAASEGRAGASAGDHCGKGAQARQAAYE